MQSKLRLPVLVCALMLFSVGCSVPLLIPFSRQNDLMSEQTPAVGKKPSAGPPRAGSLTREETAHSPTSSDPQQCATTPDLAGVLDKLQRVREMDRSAEQQLVEELRRTPPDSWPLVAEQFSASVAYHQRLVARKQTTTGPGETPGESQGAVKLDAGSASSTERSAIERPSAPIGALMDPRRTSADGISSEALAHATPYSVPPPGANDMARAAESSAVIPADFATDGPIYSMASKTVGSVPLKNLTKDWPVTTSATSSVTHASLTNFAEQAAVNWPSADLQQDDHENWQQLVERAAEDLAGRVAKSPTTTAEVHQHVSLRVLRLLAGDTERALEPIPHISPTEHDYWSRQLFALATYLDHHSQPDDKRRAAASVTHLDEAVSHLRELGSLSARNLTFCKNVYGYGAIEAYDADSFSPGESVSLYVEVENYHSKSTEKGYCTSLGSTYEILNEQGERVGGGDIPDVNDCCRRRRRDFHIQYGLALPEKLPPGKYRLQLVIKDRQSDKMGHATAAFEVTRTTP